MNIILFEQDFFNNGEGLLPKGDERAEHIRRILKFSTGDLLKAGLFNGPVGEVRVEGYVEEGIRLSWRETGPAVGLYPLTLIVGYTRPISAKRILREAASLGAARIVWTGTETGEKSYREAKLWKEERRHRFLVDGLQQAGATVLPELLHAGSVRELLSRVLPSVPPLRTDGPAGGSSRAPGESPGMPASGGNRAVDTGVQDGPEEPELLLLDNESGRQRLSELDLSGASHVVVAVGSERGWTGTERTRFSEAGFRPVRLGGRILRTETACAVGTAVALSRMGFL